MVELFDLFLAIEGLILLGVVICVVTIIYLCRRRRASARTELPLPPQQPIREVAIEMPWIGLTESELQRLPGVCNHALYSREGCTMCMDDILDGQTTRTLPACRHVFHRDCIDKWLSINAACPICRDDLLLSVYKVEDEAEAV